MKENNSYPITISCFLETIILIGYPKRLGVTLWLALCNFAVNFMILNHKEQWRHIT